MLLQTPESISSFLTTVAEGLDIPDHLYEDAVVRYEDVGNWLAADDSALARYSPEIYPQGSFRLGTVIRPISHEDEYDIDLVCHLTIAKEQTTQADLKKLVGDRLSQRSDLLKRLDERRRCWSLNYAQSFHMDVLPSIPNVEQRPTGILLTDTELVRWQKSDPITYADWFREQMKVVFTLRKALLAESRSVGVDQVPEWQVRTPLQRVVQILKRHRDIYFSTRKQLELRPVSIIITTLAARAYGNQEDIYESLDAALTGMAAGIQKLGDKYYVGNPVEPDENFADKWNERPERRMAFFGWLDAARQDILSLGQKANLSEAAAALSPMLGANLVKVAAARAGIGTGSVSMSLAGPSKQEDVPAVANVGHVQSPPWPVVLQGKANIQGSVYSCNKQRRLWELSSRSLPKHVSLKFVLSTNVRSPYEVRWQVVNTGDEAAGVGQLRGGFESNGGTTHWESTLYAGTHWVEAFVLTNGVCVARSGRQWVKVRK